MDFSYRVRQFALDAEYLTDDEFFALTVLLRRERIKRINVMTEIRELRRMFEKEEENK